MSFFTWRWLLPQKLHSSCSFPSVARAICVFFYLGFAVSSTSARLSVRDHLVDDAVLLGLLGRHVVVAFHVLRDFVGGLVRMLTDDLLQAPLQVDRLTGLDL